MQKLSIVLKMLNKFLFKVKVCIILTKLFIDYQNWENYYYKSNGCVLYALKMNEKDGLFRF